MSTVASVIRDGVKVVEVDWIDSANESGWVSEDEVKLHAGKPDYLDCVSVGYLIREDEDSVTIALGLSWTNTKKTDRDLHSALTIPRSQITATRTLVARGSRA